MCPSREDRRRTGEILLECVPPLLDLVQTVRSHLFNHPGARNLSREERLNQRVLIDLGETRPQRFGQYFRLLAPLVGGDEFDLFGEGSRHGL
ncbi:MAG: hypothetical protein ABJC13_23415 [Acidobacteriota bacterium]